MNENDMLQAILNEIKSINGEINSINGEIKSINQRLDTLDEGQKAIRRDVATVSKKLDRLSSDVGLTLAGVTDLVGEEIKMLKAK